MKQFSNTDYRTLLIKYIAHVKDENGSTGINVIQGKIVSHIDFTDKEAEELDKLADLSKEPYG
jgi:hypothetical protein